MSEWLCAPGEHDEVVTTAIALWSLLNRSSVRLLDGLSLRLSGTFSLGDLDNSLIVDDEVVGKTIFPWIELQQTLCLWSNDSAVLHGQRAGRIFHVASGGSLQLHGITLRDGYARGNGGGCMLLNGGRVQINDGRFENCEITRTSGTALGGAIGVRGGDLQLSDTNFTNTTVISEVQNSAFGGGVAVHGGGSVTMWRVRFERTNVRAQRNHGFGGGIGSNGGTVTIYESEFVDTSVSSITQEAWGGAIGLQAGTVTVFNSTMNAWVNSTENEAVGGCVGTYNGGDVTLFDSSLVNCSVHAGTMGYGAAVASPLPGTRVTLNNVSISGVDSALRVRGLALASAPRGIKAAILNLTFARRDVDDADSAADATAALAAGSDSPLIATGSPQNGAFGLGGELLLRELSVDALRFELLDTRTQLLNCSQGESQAEEVCGARAVCEDSNATYSTPRCFCKHPDPGEPVVGPIPSPRAHSSALAPYEQGCVPPTNPTDWQLNPNWWRASDATDDVRECVAGWRLNQPTPCRGGTNSSDYCEPGRGLTGPMCRVCERDGYYFHPETAYCLQCPVEGIVAFLQSFALVGFLIAILVGPLYLLTLCRHRKVLRSVSQWAETGLQTFVSFFDTIGVAEVIVPRLGLIGKVTACLPLTPAAKLPRRARQRKLAARLARRLTPRAFDFRRMALTDLCAADTLRARPRSPSVTTRSS